MKRLAYLGSIILGTYLAFVVLCAPALAADTLELPTQTEIAEYLHHYPAARYLSPRRLTFAVARRMANDASLAEYKAARAELSRTGQDTDDRIKAIDHTVMLNHPEPLVLSDHDRLCADTVEQRLASEGKPDFETVGSRDWFVREELLAHGCN
jgi:hypothetical protein